MTKRHFLVLIISLFIILLSACSPVGKNSNENKTKEVGKESSFARGETEFKDEQNSSESVQPTDQNNPLTDTQTADNQPENIQNTQETEQVVTIERPTADVTGGVDLAGTWVSKTVENNTEDQLVLALNSDNSFEFFEDVIGDNIDCSAIGNGSYTTDNSTLLLTFYQTREDYNDETFKPIFHENTNYLYTLNDNTLTLVDTNGVTYTFNRE